MDSRTIVISGGTDGMGRALALRRLAQGDHVIAVGSNAEKGARLVADAATVGGRAEVVRADLTTVAGARSVIRAIEASTDVVDALVLCANRVRPRRVETTEGFESTFALYYLSRYLLSHGLTPALKLSASPVIVNVAGVGTRNGTIHWDDLQLTRRYRAVAAQLQAGRANDLLGVGYAARHGDRVPYVLYHPGFTRSGDLSTLPRLTRGSIRVAARLFARPVEAAVAPIDWFIDAPPPASLTAVDRDRRLPLTLPTLDADRAGRLAERTAALLDRLDRVRGR
ncbi:SDR family NAD(P)-dependent oxidoreductase [Jiangella sp. DSM 45060]|uniref:SDR family NAD(P)-dependent oxidoreductase n=1 Tax=Jiangella sp. DSM 45060 TaxID=1798224 RepID=UPI00087C81CD|nr:SDR family NAD(P)-dependent oxidoreductase [Jiangella sp. DSM 45060]SDT66786.1 short chain dehydrogenase [Jiangella sp. DSM 45060]